MANPQKEDGYLPIARELQDAIMLTRFTRRQRSILDLIVRLSYGCQKRDCIIPRQKDFKVTGIGEGHIKSEIDHLIEAKVIGRDGERYWINKDYDKWRVSISPESRRLKELIHLNLSDKTTYRNGKIKGNSEKDNLPKWEVETYQNGKNSDKQLTETVSGNLLKREVEEDLNAGNRSEKDVPIDSVIDSKDKTITERETVGDNEIPFLNETDSPETTPSLSPYDDLLNHWNSTKPKERARQGLAHVLIYSPIARSMVKKRFEDGYTLEDLKACATNFQARLDIEGEKATWPNTPLTIDVFYEKTFESYLPKNFDIKNYGGKHEPDYSKIPVRLQ